MYTFFTAYYWVPIVVATIISVIILSIDTKKNTGGIIVTMLLLGAVSTYYLYDSYKTTQELEITVTPTTITNIKTAHMQYDLLFTVSNKVYHTGFTGTISINPALNTDQITLVQELDNQGQPQYKIKSVTIKDIEDIK